LALHHMLSRSTHTSPFLLSILIPPPQTSTLFPYTTLFRSKPRCVRYAKWVRLQQGKFESRSSIFNTLCRLYFPICTTFPSDATRSEEHTSELQSHLNLVCRLLLEKKKQISTDDSA